MFTTDFFKMPKDLPPGEINSVTDTVSLALLEAGTYTFSVTLTDSDDVIPVAKLAIKGRTNDGWYPISKIQVVK